MVTLYVKRNEDPAKERTGGLRSGGVEAIPTAPKGRGAPLDGTPVRLFVSAGHAIASFWSAERSQEAFGDGEHRGGWFLLDDEAVEPCSIAMRPAAMRGPTQSRSGSKD